MYVLFWYLIISLIILTYLLYRTITNNIRWSKGLPMKKYRLMYYSFYNEYIEDNDDYPFALIVSIFWPFFWGIHWPLYIIRICCKHIVLPLLTRLTLSKEERVQVALGATPNKKEEE